MEDDVFKTPRMKRKAEYRGWSSPRKRRTKEDFFTFCNIVLAYTNYESTKQEEMRTVNNSSPLGSVGSSVDSYSSESSLSSMSPSSSYGFNDETLPSARLRVHSDEEENLVTCFCMKPYGGRPMIECSYCLTWVHLSCAKIRKSKIPDTYVCQKCRDSQANPRKSNRMRTEKRRDSS